MWWHLFLLTIDTRPRLPSFPRLLGPDWGCSGGSSAGCVQPRLSVSVSPLLPSCSGLAWAATLLHIQMSSTSQDTAGSNRAFTAPTHAQPRPDYAAPSEPSQGWVRNWQTWTFVSASWLFMWGERVWTNQFVWWEVSCLSQCEENLYCVGGSVRGSLKLNEVMKVIITSNLSNLSHSIVELRALLWCDVEDCSKYISLFNLWFQIL